MKQNPIMSHLEFIAETGPMVFKRITRLDMAGRKVNANKKIKTAHSVFPQRDKWVLSFSFPYKD